MALNMAILKLIGVKTHFQNFLFGSGNLLCMQFWAKVSNCKPVWYKIQDSRRNRYIQRDFTIRKLKKKFFLISNISMQKNKKMFPISKKHSLH